MEAQDEEPTTNKICEHNAKMEFIEYVADLLRQHCSERDLPIFNHPNVKGIMIETIIGPEPSEQ